MADISKIKLPNGSEYDIKDTTARSQGGVTGVKGNAESSYRTGQVNITAGNIGAVDKSGDTMTGNLVAPAIRIANTYYGVSFGRTTKTPTETILYTGIQWRSGLHMPVVHITGYAYGLSSPVEFKIGFYIYNNNIGYCGVTNMGSWSPDVYLFKYTSSGTEYVAIGFLGSCYFLQLQADVQDEMSKFNYISVDSSNWSWVFNTTASVVPTPDSGVTCIKVPYKADILNSSKVNGHTVNKDVPANAVFTDTVTTATTTGSGNAITAISASNGAITATKETTFLTSHQDISGKADKSATVSTVAWDSTNKKLTKTINGTTSDVVTAATLRTGLNVADGAEVNQNAFSYIKVDSTNISAKDRTDILKFEAGSNITLTPDDANNKVTIAVTTSGADYILEEGTSGSWFYRKWNSGKYECWMRDSSKKATINTAWGSFYYGTISAYTYPITFVGDYPIVSITVQATNGGAWAVPNYSDYSFTSTGTIYLYRPSTISNMNITVNVYVYGRWKV